MDLHFKGQWISSKKVGEYKSKRSTNRYRTVDPNSRVVFLEFELEEGVYAKCSIEDKHLLDNYHWHIHNTKSVRTTVKIDGVSKTSNFKRMVLPESENYPIEPINGDKFDFRRENLRIVKQVVRKDLNHVQVPVVINKAVIKTASKWREGSPGGSATFYPYGMIVRFSSPTLTKPFCYTSYKSKKEAISEAKKFRYEEADRRGLVRNKIRNVTLEDGTKCLEVQTNGPNFLCDLEDIKHVKRVVWSVRKDSNTFYVNHSNRARRELKSERFHKVVVPYDIVDHINGDGLDNRKINLRDGSKGVNPRNAKIRKDNDSGITGVCFTKGAWTVQWPENGTRKSKRFGSSYGTEEEAKAAAIEFRLEKNTELNLHPRQ